MTWSRWLVFGLATIAMSVALSSIDALFERYAHHRLVSSICHGFASGSLVAWLWRRRA